MGTKMAPTYSTLTLGYLEEKMYKEIDKLFNEGTEMHITNHWKRYLDDYLVFGILQTTICQGVFKY